MKIHKSSVLLGLVLSLSLSTVGCSFNNPFSDDKQNNEVILDEAGYSSYADMENAVLPGIVDNSKIIVWYEKADDKPYVEGAATEFTKKYGVEVETKLYEDTDYIAAINKANTGEAVDVFLLSNDEIRKANLAGLIEENVLYSDEFLNANYLGVTKNALTTDGDVYGYPLYFDTTVLVYNSALTENAPKTFDDILAFADNFEDTEGNKTIFKWDVVDPMYDYTFLGGYSNVLGDVGEDKDNFDVTSSKVVDTMTYFQSLSQYFSMSVDTSVTAYEDIKKQIAEGTIIYSMCKTDILDTISTEGNPYKIAVIPALTKELDSASISVTTGAFVNSHSDNRYEANLFAAYMSYEYAKNQYGLTKKVATRQNLEDIDDNRAIIYEQYKESKALPKALEMGEFWLKSESTYENIRKGNDVKSELDELQTYMKDRF